MDIFVGNFVHSTEDAPKQIFESFALGVLDSKIVFFENSNKLSELERKFEFCNSDVYHMTQDQFMIPGFVDAHVHAPQFPNNGLGLDLPLLDWLNKYTFPTEAKFKDVKFAKCVYQKVVDRLLRNGTTTASYYATLHNEASKALADIVLMKGQRGFIGKVNMMRNCPNYYQETDLESSLADTEEFVEYVLSLKSTLVKPIITPRFAPTCPEKQLAKLGELAEKFNCRIQTHLCETKDEIEWVKQLFSCDSYTNVYKKANLLGPKTVLAHCVWTNDNELETLKEYNCGIVHCPNSNLSLKSGICDVKVLKSRDLKVALGTDCSAGYSSSMLDAIRLTVLSSHALLFQKDIRPANGVNTVDVWEAFKLATLGGAQVLKLDDQIGNFTVGKSFDALLIDLSSTGSPVDLFEVESLEEKVQKFLMTGDDRNIVRVYVNGNKIISKQSLDPISPL